MPHTVNFDDIENKLFLLEQLCHGSHSYCKTNPENLKVEYFPRLRFNVSNYLIDCAIKTRIVEDLLRSSEREKTGFYMDDLDQRARSDLKLGSFQDKEKLLTVRGSCNKIIHATEVNLDWENDAAHATSPKYWNGTVHLKGSRGKATWHVLLNVKAWCSAMKLLHEILRSEVGWYGVYEDLYDEEWA